MWRGRSFSSIATGHFSSASGRTVWLVKLQVAQTRPHARVQPSPSSSMSTRISSGMSSVGCVSFIWKATLSGNAAQPPGPGCASLKRRTTSWTVEETKKCCCFRRSSLPSNVRSSG